MRALAAAPSLSAAMLVASCNRGAPELPDAALLPRGVGLLVVESAYDGTEAYVEAIDPATHVASAHFGAGYDPDPHLRRLTDPRDGFERIFIVGSAQGAITEVDRAGHILRSMPTWDDGEAAGKPDPLDLAIAADGALWITRWSKGALLVLEADGRRRTTVDLSSYAPSNAPASGAPGMSAIAIFDRTAYVALQRLDATKVPPAATNASQLVAIDTSTLATRKVLDLPATDPFERFEHRQDSPSPKLWIACIGGPLSDPPVYGALVRIDLAASTAEVVLDGKAHGFFVTGFDVADDHEAWATVASYRAGNATSLVRFDPTTKVVEAPVLTTPSYRLWDVAIVGTELLVVDRSAERPAIDVLAASDGALLGSIALHEAPAQLLVLRAPQ